MRIDRLDLIAYGCFTDRTLDLAAPGVHVVHGPNEAGKSTARHALDQLLYGVDRQTSYDFVHAMRDLSLGALVRDEDGGTLELVRYKRDRNAITHADGTPADIELARVLKGVGRDDFRNVFALDHAGLRAGGDKLLRGEGEVGRTLFESRSSVRLGDVLARLEDRADELYKTRGRKPTINLALDRLRGLRRDVAEARLPPERFAAAAADVELAERERERLGTAWSRARAAAERLDRIREARPLVARRTALLAERADLVERGPLVPPDVARELAALDGRLAESARAAERADADLVEARGELAELVVDEGLLAHDVMLADLHAEVAAIREALDVVDDADDVAAQAREQAAECIARVRPDRIPADPTAYALPDGVADRITALRDGLGRGEAGIDGARERVAQRAEHLAATRAAHERRTRPADPAVLRALVRTVPRSLAADVERAVREVDELDRAAADLRARYGLDKLDRASEPFAARPRPPARERVVEHAEQARHVRTELLRIPDVIEESAARLADNRRDIDVLRAEGAPPTPEQWAEAKALRDAAWTVICASPPLTDERIDAYENAVAAADAIAERLTRRAADAARLARLEADVTRDVGAIERARRRYDELTARRCESATEWAALWAPSGLDAPDPDAAVALLDDLDTLAATERASRVAQANLAAHRERMGSAVGRLRAALTASGVEELTDGPDALITLAEDRCDALAEVRKTWDDAEAGVRAAEAELASAHADLARAQAERATWDRRRHDLARELDLPDADPDELAAAVATLTVAAHAIDRSREAAERRDRAATRVAAFAARVAEAFTACARPVPADPVGPLVFDAVSAVHDELTAARAAHAQTSALRTRIARLEAAYTTEREAVQRAHRQLAVLATASNEAETGPGSPAAAGPDDVAILRDAVARAARVAELDRLIGEQRGLLSPDIEREALEQDVLDGDELDVLIADARRRADEARAEYEAAGTEYGRRQQVLLDLGSASDAAADANARAVGTVAEIAADTEEFVRLRLARDVLLRCMEDYRKQNQAPVLARAEEVFRALTAGRFDRLLVETDRRKGTPVLRVRRAGRRPDAVVDIDEMSEGTRDQLYLALRLASLDTYANSGRAMPLVLDDIAMTFDDGRTRAMLEVLDAMADRFQVVLFTHHPHLGELATAALGPTRAHLHELPVYTPAV